jgi:hypothetical protein
VDGREREKERECEMSDDARAKEKAYIRIVEKNPPAFAKLQTILTINHARISKSDAFLTNCKNSHQEGGHKN